VANPAKTTKRGMDNMEKILRVYGDFTDITCHDLVFGDMHRVITQDPLEIPWAFRPPVIPAWSRNNIISKDLRNFKVQ
jgi:hypothetical protein